MLLKLADNTCINLDNVTSVRCYSDTMYIGFLGGGAPLEVSNSEIDGATVQDLYKKILERCE